jgi:hypothetical protein
LSQKFPRFKTICPGFFEGESQELHVFHDEWQPCIYIHYTFFYPLNVNVNNKISLLCTRTCLQLRFVSQMECRNCESRND